MAGAGYGWIPTLDHGVGRRTRWVNGVGIPAGATPGLALSLGAGCRTTTVAGNSFRGADGYGSLAISGRGLQAGSRGFTARLGSVGFPPRLKRRCIACGNNCGGGVVSASTFRHGGRVTSNLMLGISPTTGVKVKEPGIIPSMGAKLTGPALSSPAAQGQGFHGNPAHAPVGADVPTTATSSPGTRHPGSVRPNSTIVFDPHADSYVNNGQRDDR